MPEPDLSDLAGFAAVAASRNFRRAAAIRGVSASSLSQAVQRLEAALNIRLLNRTTRTVALTAAGERLLQRLTPALSEIAAAIDVVNEFRDSPTGTLRLNVPGVVARLVLPTIVPAFLQRHPDIVVEVVGNENFVDILSQGFDAGVRYEERLEQDMIAVPIGPRVQRFAAAAAPAYLAARGTPVSPNDLLQHAFIRHRFPSGVTSVWEFERNGGVVRIKPDGPLVADTIELEVAGAVSGLGIIATFEEWLAPALHDGRLVPVLPDWWQEFSGPFLYFSSRRQMPAALRAFVDFIKEHRAEPA